MKTVARYGRDYLFLPGRLSSIAVPTAADEPRSPLHSESHPSPLPLKLQFKRLQIIRHGHTIGQCHAVGKEYTVEMVRLMLHNAGHAIRPDRPRSPCRRARRPAHEFAWDA